MGLSIYMEEIKLVEVADTGATHNVAPMAQVCGCYELLWRGETGTLAENLIEPLEKAIKVAQDKKATLEALNPDNGWGSYETFLRFLQKTLQNCKDHPKSKVTFEP